MKNRAAHIVIYGLVLCSSLSIAVSSCARRSDPRALAEELTYAFIEGDLERAKSVTVPEQWDELEKQMSGRKPFECLEPDWEDTGLSGSGFYNDAEDEVSWGFLYQCASYRTPYSFQINDILIKKVGNVWKVHSWGTICEEPDLPSHFCE